MKRIFFYLILLCISQITWSQEPTALTDSIISYSFSSSTDSVFNSKTVSLSDPNGHKTLDIFYNWDLDLFTWVEVSKCEYAFDSKGDIILESLFHWDSSIALWIDYSKREYAYDAQGNIVLETYFKWDSGLSDWLETIKSEYSYDAYGNNTIVAHSTWDLNLNVWASSSKFEVSYDSYGNGILSEFHNWNSNLNDWLGLYKNEDVYDYDGNKTSRIVSYWNSNASDWMVSDKLEYLYNINEKRLSETYFSWNSNQNDWFYFCKKELTYDSKGNNTQSTSFAWDSDTNDWKVLYKSSYYYDSRYQIESASICSGDSILWQGEFYDTEGTYYANYLSITGADSVIKLDLLINPKPASFNISGQNIVIESQSAVYTSPTDTELVYSWLAENGDVLSQPSDNSAHIQWGDTGEGTIYGIAENQYGCKSDTSKLTVSIETSNINDILNNQIRIYPNPAKDNIFVNISDYEATWAYQLKIINQLGSVIFETNVEDQLYEINVHTWTGKGLYFVQLIDSAGHTIVTEKIIVQ